MKTIGWIIVLLIIVGLFLLFVYKWGPETTEENAISFVYDDLEAKYPNAEYEILYINENATTTDGKGKYFTIKAGVVDNSDPMCPERIHLYYNYPEQGFVTQPPDYITKDCNICINQPTCQLIYDEEAIIASHILEGTEAVHQYLEQYSDARPTVTPPPTGENEWIVTWDSPEADFYYVVYVSRDAQLIDVISEFKE